MPNFRVVRLLWLLNGLRRQLQEEKIADGTSGKLTVDIDRDFNEEPIAVIPAWRGVTALPTTAAPPSPSSPT